MGHTPTNSNNIYSPGFILQHSGISNNNLAIQAVAHPLILQIRAPVLLSDLYLPFPPVFCANKYHWVYLLLL